MDLNRQALLVAALAVLVPAAGWHAWRPAALARTIRDHAVLPGARSRPTATLYAVLVVAGELAIVALGVVALATEEPQLSGVASAVAGLAFVAYVAALLGRGYEGECGCSPAGAGLTRLSLAPGAALFVVGGLLALGRSFDDVALADGPDGAQTALALAAAVLLGGLVSLLPASALTGDPVRLGEPVAPATPRTSGTEA